MAHRYQFALTVVSAFLICSVVTSSWAAIPPSEFLVKKTAQKRSGLKGLKLQSLVQVSLGDPDSFREDITTPSLPLKVTTWLDYENQRVTSVVSNEAGATVAESVRSFSVEGDITELPRFGMAALESQSARLLSLLKGFSVPVLKESELLSLGKTEAERQTLEQSRLERIEGKPAWTVGIDPNLGRAWFDKDTLSLIRLSVPREKRTLIFSLRWPKWVEDFPFARQWVLEVAPRTAVDPSVSPQQKIATITVIREDFKEVNSISDIKSPSIPKLNAEISFTSAGEALNTKQRNGVEFFLRAFR